MVWCGCGVYHLVVICWLGRRLERFDRPMCMNHQHGTAQNVEDIEALLITLLNAWHNLKMSLVHLWTVNLLLLALKPNLKD